LFPESATYTLSEESTAMPSDQVLIMSHNRALVLQGGGALGAYEAGVLDVLCKKLHEEDKENKREDSLVFDIVAGTSIGATNAAILVSLGAG
jgi:predicted acylesterase/phospholipase RssA